MENIKSNKIKILPYDWLLIIGFLLSPMNEFRIGKVGPAEVVCLLWALPQIMNALHDDFNSILERFWMIFLMVVIIGTFYGELFYPDETNYKGVFTYIYFTVISVGVYKGLKKRDKEYILVLMKKSFELIPILYILIYIYSKNVSPVLFGARLWFGGVRFTGGANNPHQLALLLSAALFGNLIFMIKEKSTIFQHIKYLIYMYICYFLGEATASSTLKASIVITAILSIYFFYISTIEDKRQRFTATAILFTFVLSAFIFLLPKIYSAFMSWLSADENGIGRLEIFKTITYVFKKNPIFGLGPGIHARDGIMEFHNTYLEILAMSGIVGFGIFVIFSVKIFKQIWNCPEYMILIIPLYSFGLAGFAFRRLVYWIMLSIVLALSEKINENNKWNSEKTILKNRKE